MIAKIEIQVIRHLIYYNLGDKIIYYMIIFINNNILLFNKNKLYNIY